MRRRTAVHIASRFPSNTDNLEFLLRRAKFSVPVAGLWKSGWTPLHDAASVLNPGAVKFLLERGVNPMALAENGRTALHQVFTNTRLNQPEFQKHAGEVIVALMENGKVDINHRDNKGKTVFGLAGTALAPLRTLLIKWGAKELYSSGEAMFEIGWRCTGTPKQATKHSKEVERDTA
ncbi:Ankyrin repeat-containing domain protein [Akanthomyces lecanii RCEF 1005]|uniref:Ankyrin repeat-containing domain protein n=1 Tax=Akanthomyces lecanii RCEF 1005 TaxID=1081108 RepID=A0A168K1M2_CORDF|nr:Ankyrin repeat-containing domain protein [Akanthomyces lecanii RCEF 1005]